MDIIHIAFNIIHVRENLFILHYTLTPSPLPSFVVRHIAKTYREIQSPLYTHTHPHNIYINVKSFPIFRCDIILKVKKSETGRPHFAKSARAT